MQRLAIPLRIHQLVVGRAAYDRRADQRDRLGIECSACGTRTHGIHVECENSTRIVGDEDAKLIRAVGARDARKKDRDANVASFAGVDVRGTAVEKVVDEGLADVAQALDGDTCASDARRASVEVEGGLESNRYAKGLK